MAAPGPRHGEQFNLFGHCVCSVCRVLQVMYLVAEQNYPTDIVSFGEIVTEHIHHSFEGEPSTRREAVRHVRRFVRWCKQQGYTDITQLKHEEIEAFVHSPTVMGGRARKPGPSTMRNRLANIKRAFRSARQIGYEVIDPTIDVVVMVDRSVDVNICTTANVEALRTGSPIGLFDATYAVLLALAEAGAANGEIKDVRACDVDLDEGVVHLHGNARVDERVNPLTEWGVSVLRERLQHVSGEDYVVANSIGTQCSEATVSQMFRQISAYANLGNKGFNINSVRGWRARLIYDDTGRIQDAAVFLGNRSLDATATLLGVKWRYIA